MKKVIPTLLLLIGVFMGCKENPKIENLEIKVRELSEKIERLQKVTGHPDIDSVTLVDSVICINYTIATYKSGVSIKGLNADSSRYMFFKAGIDTIPTTNKSMKMWTNNKK